MQLPMSPNAEQQRGGRGQPPTEPSHVGRNGRPADEPTAPPPVPATSANGETRAPTAKSTAAAAREGKRVELCPGRPLLIGSAPDSSIVIEGDGAAPRQASILLDSSGHTAITDLANNGRTQVNGVPVRWAELIPGAELRIGEQRFVFAANQLIRFDEAHDVRVDALHLRQTVRSGPFGLGRKVLLDDVSLTLLPGTFVAVVGASGAGKSTLLRALSGQAGVQSGRVLYNGRNLPGHRHDFCTTLGYVPQDDIVHKNLPLDAALYYAARLRLRKGTPRRQVIERVNQVLEDVELTPQRHQLISQLSGGQRKRVNIALELLGRPSIFYLDEPTSGLDPGLDLKMMQLLRRLADRGQTIVLVTHTTENIDLCDDICFLAPDGKMAYYGPPDGLKRFFHTDSYAEIYNALYDDPDTWVQRFRQSPDFLNYVDGPRLQSENLAQHEPVQTVAAPEDKRGGERSEAGCGIGDAMQLSLLTRRYVRLLVHDRVNLLILLLQAPIIAWLVTLLAEKNGIYHVMHPQARGLHADIFAQRTLFILVCSAIWFGIINAAREIVKEDQIYRRERAVNLHIGPYVASKVLVLGVLCAIQSALLLGIVGLKSGYPTSGILWPGQTGAIAELFISLLLCALAGLMLGLMVSAFAPTTDRALSIVPIVLIPQIIFSGVIFSMSHQVAKTISYLMPARWGMQATGSIARISDKFAQMDIPFYRSDPSHLLGFWAATVALIVLFLLLTLLFMRRKDLRD